jgi:hypothetical protein
MQIRKNGDEIKKIFFSETTEPISTKLCYGADGHNFERGPPKDHFSKV